MHVIKIMALCPGVMGVIFSCSRLLWGTCSELFNNMQKGLVNKKTNKVLE